MDFTKMSVDEIRTKLVELGLSEQEAKLVKGKKNLILEYARITGSAASLLQLSKVSDDELREEPTESEVVPSEELPKVITRVDPEWHDFVMSHFVEEELVEDPNSKKKLPNVDGLRRVSELLIGTIIRSEPTVHGSMHSQNLAATVSYTVVFDEGGLFKQFGGAADCHEGNIDQAYSRYPTANAETRAEARALRKALGLRKILAAEEVSMAPKEESWLPENMSELQMALIEKKCKEADIDVLKFINMGKVQYVSWKDVPRDKAGQMVQHLNEYHRDALKIPEEIKGYKEGWRS